MDMLEFGERPSTLPLPLPAKKQEMCACEVEATLDISSPATPIALRNVFP